MEIAEKPFLHVQAVGDGARGLALLSNGGLHEGGVMDDARRTMQITLLRSLSKTVATGGEEEGQEQGTLKFRYALMPYNRDLPKVEVMQQLARLQTPVLTRQSGSCPSGFPALKGNTPQLGLLKAEGDLVVSAIKSSEAGGDLVVRLWNPSEQLAQSTLKFDSTLQSAKALKLNEDEDDGAPSPQINGRALTIEAAPHRIVTLRVSFEELS